MPQNYEIVSSHPTEDLARYSAQSLLRFMGGLPSGWALALWNNKEGGVDVVKYYARTPFDIIGQVMSPVTNEGAGR